MGDVRKKQDPSESTTEEKPQKNKWPLAVVSILTNETRIKREVGHSKIYEKEIKREEMES